MFCERPFLVKKRETMMHEVAPVEDESLLREPIAITSKRAQASI
jgi:hypothetical protein